MNSEFPRRRRISVFRPCFLISVFFFVSGVAVLVAGAVLLSRGHGCSGERNSATLFPFPPMPPSPPTPPASTLSRRALQRYYHTPVYIYHGRSGGGGGGASLEGCKIGPVSMIVVGAVFTKMLSKRIISNTRIGGVISEISEQTVPWNRGS